MEEHVVVRHALSKAKEASNSAKQDTDIDEDDGIALTANGGDNEVQRERKAKDVGHVLDHRLGLFSASRRVTDS